MYSSQNQSQSSIQEIELDIANILKGIAFWEISVENQKLKLAENPNFDVHHVWNKLDIYNRGYINNIQLKNFLEVNRIAASEREVDMLLQINSNQKGIMDLQAYYTQILPQTNKELRDYVLNRKEIQQQQQIQHFTSDIMIGSFSEQSVANIFGEELKFYREIEQLRQEFARKHGMTTNQVYQIVDYQNTNIIDLNCLCNFFNKIGIEFSEDEYWALQQRITVDTDSKIDYEELINAIMPREPFDYPQFRQEFQGVQNKNYVQSKYREFGSYISAPSFGKVDNKQKIDPQDHYYPLNRVFNPYEKGRNSYFCDKGYMGQLKEYRNMFYKPNKDYNYHYRNEGNKGIRYLDSHFKDFNTYLFERDQNEAFFNKFGKRYQAEDKLVEKQQQQQIQKEKQKIKNFSETVQIKQAPRQTFGSPGSAQNNITINNAFQDFE